MAQALFRSFFRTLILCLSFGVLGTEPSAWASGRSRLPESQLLQLPAVKQLSVEYREALQTIESAYFQDPSRFERGQPPLPSGLSLQTQTYSFAGKDRIQFRLFHDEESAYSEIAVWAYDLKSYQLMQAWIFIPNSIGIHGTLVEYSFEEPGAYSRVILLNPDILGLSEIYPRTVPDYLPWVVLGRELNKALVKDPIQKRRFYSNEDYRKEALKPVRTWVTLVDSGIDYNHPEIAMHLIRSELGTDLADLDPLPYDDTSCLGCTDSKRSHGTSVAGALLKGLPSDVKVYTIRLVGVHSMKDLVSEIRRSYELGSRVVNISISDRVCENWEGFRSIIQELPGMFFIFAASNSGQSLNDFPLCPAVFQYPNTLTVGSVNPEGRWSVFSAYGSEFVQLAAVGERLRLPKAGGGSHSVSGTSFAAPQVARVIAAIQRARPGIALSKIRRCLQDTIRKSEELFSYTQWGGVLDAKAAYQCALSEATQSD